jgi:hypothetical protein
MTTSQLPRRHHFAPVFYLRRWAGADGEVEQFNMPHNRMVRARRLHPAATGFKVDLYALPGFAPELAQQVESTFMQTVDSRAAAVLARMEDGHEPRDRASRSDWTRFLQSLQLRTPSDMTGLKDRARADWGRTVPEIQARYEALREDGDPDTFEAFIEAKDPLLVERIGVRLATVLIDHAGLGERINKMDWDILDLERSNVTLLTSDHAVEQALGLRDPRAFITLPVGPKRLFIAANTRRTIDALAAQNPRDVVMHRNRTTVKCARDYVWAQDRTQAAFIGAHMGSVSVRRLSERLAADASASDDRREDDDAPHAETAGS